MATEEDNKLGIYVELDALLDTRLSTIFSLVGKEGVVKVLENGYTTRNEDVFHGIDKVEFDLAYEARDKTVLVNSIVTNVILYIKQLCITAIREAIVSPLTTGAKIYVNVWPYKLNDDEVDTIVKALVLATGKTVDVKAIDRDRESLTPDYCRTNFDVMFMYKYGPWLDTQQENFKKSRCITTTLLVPGIYFERAPSEDEMLLMLKSGMHPLRQFELGSSIYVDLKFQDIGLFCASMPSRTT